jgi:ABC-type uncharacterized transport system ATPase subunit
MAKVEHLTVQRRPHAARADQHEIALRGEDLTKTYGGRTVVDHVNVQVNPGEVVGLLGPNGAGKTTTFYMLVGLVKPDSGRVLLGEQEITMLPLYQRARSGISSTNWILHACAIPRPGSCRAASAARSRSRARWC